MSIEYINALAGSLVEKTKVTAALQFAQTPDKIIAVRCYMPTENSTRFNMLFPREFNVQQFVERVMTFYTTRAWCVWGGNSAEVYLPGKINYIFAMKDDQEMTTIVQRMKKCQIEENQ